MKKTTAVVALVLFFVLSVSVAFAAGHERHPRLQRALVALDGAIAELKAAPHDFGGHREAAVDACQRAKEQLKLALNYDKH
jgi:hypothetical protein